MILRSCTSANAGSWYKWSKGSSHRDPETEILYKLSHRILIQRSVHRIPTQRSWNRDLAQVVPQDLDTEISHKCAYRILMQWAKRSCCRDLAQVGSWYKWSKGSSHRDPETEILQKLSRRILIQRSRTSAPIIRSWYSGPKDPTTEILHKCSYRILIQVVQRIIHTEILKQRSCTSCPTGSWYRDLAQVVLEDPTEDPDTSGPKASWYEILCKWSYRILMQVVQKDTYTEMIKRSCTSANAGSRCKWPKGSSHRGPETEILHKLSHRILIQRSHTSAPIGSWCSGPKDPAAEILHK